MKKIFINATSCIKGGAVQVAVGVIREALNSAEKRGWVLFLAVSSPVMKAVKSEFPLLQGNYEQFMDRPGTLRSGRYTRIRLRELALLWRPDIVFTVFGPSYVSFPVPEYMGFADPFVITPTKGSYANHSFVERITYCLRGHVKRVLLHTADHYWVETETAKRGICKQGWVSSSKVDVVSNGVNAGFAAALKRTAPAASCDILLLGAGYPHKNHALIVPLANTLQEIMPDRLWRFVVTLPEDDKVWMQLKVRMSVAGLGGRVVNLGVLNLAQCAAAYEAATLVLHPSLIEIFSATYVEAMAARRPLVVSDRDFAHEICGDAALYFDPLDTQAAAKAVHTVLTDMALRADLVAKGIERLARFPDAAEKNSRLCDLIDKFSNKQLNKTKT